MFVGGSQESGKGKFTSSQQKQQESLGTGTKEKDIGSKGFESRGGVKDKGVKDIGGGRGDVLMIGDTFPDFTEETNHGKLSLNEWLSGGDENTWGIIFIHNKAFSPICTTELAHLATSISEFERRNCKVAALICDTCENVSNWVNDIQDLCGKRVDYTIICDQNKNIVKSLGLCGDGEDCMSSRGVYFLGPNKMIETVLLYPEFVGRNYDEVLRLLDALQVHCDRHVKTPVNWHRGEKCLVPENIREEECNQKFGHVETLKPYLRMTEQA